MSPEPGWQKDLPRYASSRLLRILCSDGPAFLVLNALAKVAVTGEPTSAKAIEQTVAGYGRAWDREVPFERLKAHLEAEGNWKKLPEALRHKIDELIK